MKDQSQKFNQMNLFTTPSATSSLESADGQSHSPSQDIAILPESGPDHARVSHSLMPDDKKVKTMLAIYGQYGNVSSESADLQRSLESKLRQQLPMGGLTMFIKGWSRKATPSHRRYCQLQVSAHPINEIDYGLWPTPCSDDQGLRKAKYSQGGSALSLVAAQVLWTTPSSRDWKDTPGMTAERKDGKSRNDQLPRQVVGVLRPTATATARVRSEETLKKCADFRKKNANQNTVPLYLEDTAILATGQPESGSPAPTGKRGSLNPEFVCWLMGFNTDVLSSMLSAMLSYLSWPQRSLRRQSKKTKK